MIGEFLMNKPVIKNLLLIGIPTLISGLGIIMTSDALSGYKDWFIIITVVLLIIFIAFVVYYARVDKKEQNEILILKETNDELQKKLII